jgi:hypothetical protein
MIGTVRKECNPIPKLIELVFHAIVEDFASFVDPFFELCLSGSAHFNDFRFVFIV